MNAAVAQKPYDVPEGGLASFLTATSGSWSDEALSGVDYEIIRPAANELAEFGREGDNRIAHVADGETVIPMEVFEEDPALKEALFGRMREMGIDPERYVVGNELNSINPVTGQPEFFLKKLFKGVKKAVKGVVKVFKKLAPVILSVGLGILFPPLGAIASGALGSGIGTLIQGGNLKDAFKAALIGGAVGGISSGIGSVMKGGEFMAGVKSGLPTGLGGGVNPSIVPKALTAAEQAKVAALESSGRITEGTAAVDLTGAEALGPEIMPPMPGADNVAAAAKESVAGATTQPDILGQLQSGQFTTDASGAIVRKTAQPDILGQLQSGQFTTDASGTIVPKKSLTQGTDAATTGATEAATTGATEAATEADKGFFGKTIDFIKGASDPTNAEIFSSVEYKNLISEGFSPAEAFVEAQKQLAPGMLAKYGPMAGLGLAGIGLAGGFKAQPMPEPYDFFNGMTREDYIQMYPERYRFTPIGRDDQGNLLPSRPVAAANGGDISSFPRKTGPIRGPGTETSDDIPAMLSDGEFVMTARAVRGAGNGSRKDGMKRMYQMMKNFEGSAARG